MAAEGGLMSDQDKFHSSTSDGNVHASQVAQEAHLTRLIAAYHADDDDIALLPLESIDRIDGDQMAERLPVGVALDELS